ncbi:MAG: arsenate reductase family protein [Bacillota bacterium]
MITLIEYPPCSTCKKAKAFLRAHNIDFVSRHIVSETPSKEELLNWMQVYDLNINQYFNTHGKKYRELKLKNRLNTLSDDTKLSLLSRDGMLIKRPLLVMNNQLLIGFNVDEWKAALKSK